MDGKELRSEETYFGDLPNLKIDPEMISIATEIIKRKSKVFDPDEFQDH
jgi:DNA end-binding protein Ku